MTHVTLWALFILFWIGIPTGFAIFRKGVPVAIRIGLLCSALLGVGVWVGLDFGPLKKPMGAILFAVNAGLFGWYYFLRAKEVPRKFALWILGLAMAYVILTGVMSYTALTKG